MKSFGNRTSVEVEILIYWKLDNIVLIRVNNWYYSFTHLNVINKNKSS